MTSTRTPRRNLADIASDMAATASRRMGDEGVAAAVVHPHSRAALSTLREFDQDGTHLGTVASARSYVRRALQGHARPGADTRMSTDECRRVALHAMARLGSVNERAQYRRTDGTPVTVGPYVSDAVNFVVADLAVRPSSTDRYLIDQFAMLYNVSARITV